MSLLQHYKSHEQKALLQDGSVNEVLQDEQMVDGQMPPAFVR